MPRLFAIIVIVFVSLPWTILSQNNDYTAGARMSAMANTSTALSDTWSGHHNQAGLARIENFSTGVSYIDRYNIKELGVKAATILIPSKGGNFNISYTQSGFNLLHHDKVGLAFARPLGKHLWAGIQLDYYSITMGGNLGTSNSYTFETGILAEPFENFFLGFHLSNPIQATIKTQDENQDIPVKAQLGWAWTISENLIICLDTEKELDTPLRMKTGVEYQVVNQLHLRAGVASHPNTISMGLGFFFSHITTDIAFSHHSVLGNSPSISINLTL